ncbi:hypothetical protein TrCOL_g954, partial [Triparma columacea]
MVRVFTWGGIGALVEVWVESVDLTVFFEHFGSQFSSMALLTLGVFESFSAKNKKLENDGLTAMTKVEGSAADLVLAGCNSLIFIDGEVAGDPLESAALKAMRWEV